MNSDVAEHGLLSQWRAYGKQGGYAVAFDTSRLSDSSTRKARLGSTIYLAAMSSIPETLTREFAKS
jgi:hypothetical protein